MKCPRCGLHIELSWSRYLRSVSGRHTCPACATTFRFRLTKTYLLLWLDMIAFALLTGAIVHIVLQNHDVYAAGDPQLLALSVVIPVAIWGSVFLALNRRALERLDTKFARGGRGLTGPRGTSTGRALQRVTHTAGVSANAHPGDPP